MRLLSFDVNNLDEESLTYYLHFLNHSPCEIKHQPIKYEWPIWTQLNLICLPYFNTLVQVLSFFVLFFSSFGQAIKARRDNGMMMAKARAKGCQHLFFSAHHLINVTIYVT